MKSSIRICVVLSTVLVLSTSHPYRQQPGYYREWRNLEQPQFLPPPFPEWPRSYHQIPGHQAPARPYPGPEVNSFQQLRANSFAPATSIVNTPNNVEQDINHAHLVRKSSVLIGDGPQIIQLSNNPKEVRIIHVSSKNNGTFDDSDMPKAVREAVARALAINRRRKKHDNQATAEASSSMNDTRKLANKPTLNNRAPGNPDKKIAPVRPYYRRNRHPPKNFKSVTNTPVFKAFKTTVIVPDGYFQTISTSENTNTVAETTEKYITSEQDDSVIPQDYSTKPSPTHVKTTPAPIRHKQQLLISSIKATPAPDNDYISPVDIPADVIQPNPAAIISKTAHKKHKHKHSHYDASITSITTIPTPNADVHNSPVIVPILLDDEQTTLKSAKPSTDGSYTSGYDDDLFTSDLLFDKNQGTEDDKDSLSRTLIPGDAQNTLESVTTANDYYSQEVKPPAHATKPTPVTVSPSDDDEPFTPKRIKPISTMDDEDSPVVKPPAHATKSTPVSPSDDDEPFTPKRIKPISKMNDEDYPVVIPSAHKIKPILGTDNKIKPLNYKPTASPDYKQIPNPVHEPTSALTKGYETNANDKDKDTHDDDKYSNQHTLAYDSHDDIPGSTEEPNLLTALFDMFRDRKELDNDDFLDFITTEKAKITSEKGVIGNEVTKNYKGVTGSDFEDFEEHNRKKYIIHDVVDTANYKIEDAKMNKDGKKTNDKFQGAHYNDEYSNHPKSGNESHDATQSTKQEPSVFKTLFDVFHGLKESTDDNKTDSSIGSFDINTDKARVTPEKYVKVLKNNKNMTRSYLEDDHKHNKDEIIHNEAEINKTKKNEEIIPVMAKYEKPQTDTMAKNKTVAKDKQTIAKQKDDTIATYDKTIKQVALGKDKPDTTKTDNTTQKKESSKLDSEKATVNETTTNASPKKESLKLDSEKTTVNETVKNVSIKRESLKLDSEKATVNETTTNASPKKESLKLDSEKTTVNETVKNVSIKRESLKLDSEKATVNETTTNESPKKESLKLDSEKTTVNETVKNVSIKKESLKLDSEKATVNETTTNASPKKESLKLDSEKTAVNETTTIASPKKESSKLDSKKVTVNETIKNVSLKLESAKLDSEKTTVNETTTNASPTKESLKLDSEKTTVNETVKNVSIKKESLKLDSEKVTVNETTTNASPKKESLKLDSEKTTANETSKNASPKKESLKLDSVKATVNKNITDASPINDKLENLEKSTAITAKDVVIIEPLTPITFLVSLIKNAFKGENYVKKMLDNPTVKHFVKNIFH